MSTVVGCRPAAEKRTATVRLRWHRDAPRTGRSSVEDFTRNLMTEPEVLSATKIRCTRNGYSILQIIARI